MSTRAVDVLFLDFFGTVAAGDAEAIDAACAAVIRDHMPDVAVDVLSRRWAEHFFAAVDEANAGTFLRLFDCQRVSLARTLSEWGCDADPTPYAEQLRDYCRRPPIYDDVREALRRVSVPVCLVSNADDADLIEALGRHELRFDAVVSSESTRSYKPDPRIFEVALQRMGVAATRSLHVGDSLHSDVGGAQALGIRTAWISRERRVGDIGTAQPDHTLSSLHELSRLL